MENKLNSLIKQNVSIYNSLLSKNIQNIGVLTDISDDMSIEDKIKLVEQDNIRLKELVKLNKPQPVEKTIDSKAQQKTDQVKKVDESIKEKDEEKDDENYNEPVAKFNTITNMEDLKRLFFSGEYEQFNNQMKEYNFKLYNVNYKYSSYKDGAPDYIAKNLIRGFVRNFDDLRKYFMICFRCISNNTNPNSYSYPSYWIVNSNDSVEKIIGSLYEEFDFVEVTEETRELFLSNLQKMNPDNEFLLGEAYVH